MRLIDADTIVNYEITGNFECGDFKGLAQCVLLPVEHLRDIPTINDYFTDDEYRILLAALGREKRVCKHIDRKYDGVVNLVDIMDSIEKKIRDIQYGSR